MGSRRAAPGQIPRLCDRGSILARHWLKVIMPAIKGKTRRPYRDRLAWMWLRNRFIALRAAGADITLARFAEKHGIVLKTLENRCQQEKWFEQVEALKQRIHAVAE